MRVSTTTAVAFYPDRRWGILFHFALILLLSGIGAFGLWQVSMAEVGPDFLVYLLPALLALTLAPVLIYRLRGLQRAGYVLERDGIRIWWGLRLEEIPMDQVIWVRSSDEIPQAFPKPWLRWPGCVLGIRRLSGGKSIEYMASQTKRLVLINTPDRIYAISPADPLAFLHAYYRLAELGSLAPLEAHSLRPAFLLARFWADRPGRYLFLGGLVFSLALLAWVMLIIPSHQQVLLRPVVDAAQREYVPSVRLLLLPVLNSFFFATDFLVGLFFFRRDENRYLSYLVWGSGVLSPILFLLAVRFIVQAS